MKANAESARELGSSFVEYARTSSEKGYRAEKPRISGENPISLVEELQAFKRYMNECKITERSTWFQQARYAVNNKSRAQTAIEQLVIDRFGSESGFQDILSTKANDDDYWYTVWNELEDYWRIKAGIEGGNEEQLGRRRYRQRKLPSSPTPSQIETVMQEYDTA